MLEEREKLERSAASLEMKASKLHQSHLGKTQSEVDLQFSGFLETSPSGRTLGGVYGQNRTINALDGYNDHSGIFSKEFSRKFSQMTDAIDVRYRIIDNKVKYREMLQARHHQLQTVQPPTVKSIK